MSSSVSPATSSLRIFPAHRMLRAVVFFSCFVSFALAVAAAPPEARFSIRSAGKYGAIDVNGTVVIAAQYDDELRFSDGMSRVRIGGRIGYIDASGQVLISPKAVLTRGTGDFAEELGLAAAISGDFSEGMAAYTLDDKYGYVDRNGMIVIAARFDAAEDFHEGTALVHTAAGYGLIGRDGKYLIEPRFERPFWFREGLAAVLVPGQGYGYIDRSGQFVIEPQYNYANDFGSGRARVQIKGRGYGFIDASGTLVIEPPADFKLGADFSGPVAPVNVAGKGWGLIDTAGRFAVTPQFFAVAKFSEGLAAVAVGDFKNHAWGYMDYTGRLVGTPGYDRAEPFSGGFGLVRIRQGGVGFVDASGKLRIGPLTEYSQVDSFKDGLARVWFSQSSDTDGSWGYLDTAGKLIWRAD